MNEGETLRPSSKNLTRVFNTALITSRVQAKSAQDFSERFHSLMETPAFHAILKAIELLAQERGITEKQAAEEVIGTFRDVDNIWNEYILHEGVEKIKRRD